MIYVACFDLHTGTTEDRSSLTVFVYAENVSELLEKLDSYLTKYDLLQVISTDYEVINLETKERVNDYIVNIGTNPTNSDDGVIHYQTKEIHVISKTIPEALTSVKHYLKESEVLLSIEEYNHDVDFIE